MADHGGGIRRSRLSPKREGGKKKKKPRLCRRLPKTAERKKKNCGSVLGGEKKRKSAVFKKGRGSRPNSGRGKKGARRMFDVLERQKSDKERKDIQRLFKGKEKSLSAD